MEGVKMKLTAVEMDTEIQGLAHDSRRVSGGELFFALRGARSDGRDYIGEAVRNGARAVVCEDILNGDRYPVPCVLVEDAREALARAAGRFFGNPSESLEVVGITGTNGKTTTSYITRSILASAGLRAGLIGTIAYMVGDDRRFAPFTTPEAPEFQSLLREMLEEGCSHVVTEVSSHALAQKRVDHTRFSVAVFTNLTREHLDFHQDMERYFRAKRRLFDEMLSGVAVINADDPYGKRLAASQKGQVITYGIESEADLIARNIKNSLGGLSFRLASGGASHRVESPLVGTINVYNILASAGASLALGLSWDSILDGVRNAREVEGRFQKVEQGQDFLVVVDYAHTEDALRRLILTAREVTPGRVITVFGCGGDRDRSKRPAMGAVATELSDVVFITSDNPRSEDPGDIIKEIVAGVRADNYRTVPDRAEAIDLAVRAACAGDTVLIAGKGHEDYQDIKGVRTKFNDRETAEAAIRRAAEGREA